MSDRVFLAYTSSLGRTFVESLAAELRALGVNARFDQDLDPTVGLSAAIAAEIDASDAVVALWSVESLADLTRGGVTATWLAGEAHRALFSHKLIQCVVLADGDVFEHRQLPPPYNSVSATRLRRAEPKESASRVKHALANRTHPPATTLGRRRPQAPTLDLVSDGAASTLESVLRKSSISQGGRSVVVATTDAVGVVRGVAATAGLAVLPLVANDLVTQGPTAMSENAAWLSARLRSHEFTSLPERVVIVVENCTPSNTERVIALAQSLVVGTDRELPTITLCLETNPTLAQRVIRAAESIAGINVEKCSASPDFAVAARAIAQRYGESESAPLEGWMVATMCVHELTPSFLELLSKQDIASEAAFSSGVRRVRARMHSRLSPRAQRLVKYLLTADLEISATQLARVDASTEADTASALEEMSYWGIELSDGSGGLVARLADRLRAIAVRSTEGPLEIGADFVPKHEQYHMLFALASDRGFDGTTRARLQARAHHLGGQAPSAGAARLLLILIFCVGMWFVPMVQIDSPSGHPQWLSPLSALAVLLARPGLASLLSVVSFLVVGVGAVMSLGRNTSAKSFQPSATGALRICAFALAVVFVLHSPSTPRSPGLAAVSDGAQLLDWLSVYVWHKLIGFIVVVVPLGGTLMALMTRCGVVALVAGIFRPIVRAAGLPGRAAADVAVSIPGSYAIAVKMSEEMFARRVYTVRDTALLVFGFSTVSLPMAHVWSRLVDVDESFGALMTVHVCMLFAVARVMGSVGPIADVHRTLASGSADIRTDDDDDLRGSGYWEDVARCWREAIWEAMHADIPIVAKDGLLSSLGVAGRTAGPIAVLATLCVAICWWSGAAQSTERIVAAIEPTFGVEAACVVTAIATSPLGFLEMLLPAYILPPICRGGPGGEIAFLVALTTVVFLSGPGLLMLQVFRGDSTREFFGIGFQVRVYLFRWAIVTTLSTVGVIASHVLL